MGRHEYQWEVQIRVYGDKIKIEIKEKKNLDEYSEINLCFNVIRGDKKKFKPNTILAISSVIDNLVRGKLHRIVLLTQLNN